MPFPTTEAAVDSTDPTSQIAWPSGRKPSNVQSPEGQITLSDDIEPTNSMKQSDPAPVIVHPVGITRVPPLTKWNLFTLSAGMAGAQVAWTVELGYGTPFLLSLGLSEQLTSLVWLAGPISGLIAQPLIGAISDSSPSRYRRRFWIGWSTVVLVVSCLALAYAEDTAAILVDLLGAGLGDWDPERKKEAKYTAVGIAISAFYLLDFALNALQASLRNLLLDMAPPEQLSAGNAWHGRMTHAGNIIGFGFGFLNLATWPVLSALGGSQFRKICVVGIVILVITVWITCWTQEERPGKSSVNYHGGFYEALKNIHNSLLNLPNPIRLVCFVQVFAFMAWFPFLFYATTYIGQVMAQHDNEDPDVDVATRAGNFALLLYSIVAVIAGSLLPELTRRDRRLLAIGSDDDEEREVERIHAMVRAWEAEATARGKAFKLPRMPLKLRDMWSSALVLYGVISMSTFFISNVEQATLAVALVGICWAIAVWAPFAMIMEFLKEADEIAGDMLLHSDDVLPETQTPRTQPTERTGLLHDEHDEILHDEPLHDEPLTGHDGPSSGSLAHQPMAGGTVLGIHNLAIVFPQFIIALIASLIFRIVDETPSTIGEPTHIYLGKNGVAWVLRFGGLCSFVGAAFVYLIPPTLQERQMKQRLAEMKAARRAILE